MRNSFALLCALIMACLAGLAHATHLKGGSVTWTRDTEAPGFAVKAEVIINFDLSAGGPLLSPILPSGTDIPRVNGHPFYKVGDIVGSAGATVDWGDGTPNSVETLTQFVVVAVDPAAQIVTAKAIEVEDTDGDTEDESVDLGHTYTWPSGVHHYDITVSDSERDTGEELTNRTNTLMLLRSRVTDVAGNTPPAYDPGQSNLVLVDRGTTRNPKVTFDVPVATDADAGDTVKYRFIEHESDASNMSTPDDTPWELLAGMEITEAGKITWDTSKIKQTIKTYCIQVVAEDYAAGSTMPKSSTTVEFQVWVDDTTQTGVPEIEVSPATPVIYFHPDQEGKFDVIGFDHGENSRLKLIYNAAEFPPGAELLPTAGFAGEGHDNEGDYLTCTFEWKPTTADLGAEYTMHFKFEDEDGFQSDEVTAKVKVVTAPPTPVEPLVLTVTPTDFTDVPQGTLITFTATGTCATAGVPLAITTYSDIPDGAAFSTPLPAQGTSSVTTTFTWQTDSHDATLPDHPIEIELILSDAYAHDPDDQGTEVKETVTITLPTQPAGPVIALAAGTTVPVTSTVWESLVANFTATGGSRQHPRLTFEAQDGGAVGNLEMASPASNRLFWRAMPGEAQSGTLHVKVTDEWGASAVLEVPYVVSNPGVPAWWDSTINSEDVLTTATPMDFSMANGGQLKAIASRAYAKLAVEFPDVATATPEGIALAAYVNSFQTSEGNYKPVVLGELKQAASLFYKAIAKLSGKGDIGFPWAEGTDDENNYSPVTVGQVKMVFSFPQPVGGVLFNEPPSSMVITSPATGTHLQGVQDITLQASASDPDGNLERVEFYKDGLLLNTDSSSPYAVTWEDAPVGSYVFTAKAIDTQGLELTSGAVTVTVDSTAPSSVAITSPVTGSHYPVGQQVPIQVTASDPDNNIQNAYLYENGTLLYSQFMGTSPSIQLNWNPSTPGSYELRVKVIDAEGQERMSDPVTIVRDSNPPPSVANFLPAQDERFAAYPSSGTVVFSAFVSDLHGVASARFFAGAAGAPLVDRGGSHIGGNQYTTTWSNLAAGSYVVELRAVDIYGASTTIQRNFTVVTPTTVTLQEGVNGYTGMVDTYLSSDSGGNDNFGTATTLSAKTGLVKRVSLLKWNLAGVIPTTARVLDAGLTLNVTVSNEDSLYLYPLAREWTEGGATWEDTGTGGATAQWTTPGAGSGNGSPRDFDYIFTATLDPNRPLGLNALNFYNKDVIQSWISAPLTNFGFKMFSTGSGASVAATVSSSEAATSSTRPKLTITYY